MKHDAIFEVASPEGMNLPPKSIGVLLKAGWLHGEQLVRYELHPPESERSRLRTI